MKLVKSHSTRAPCFVLPTPSTSSRLLCCYPCSSSSRRISSAARAFSPTARSPSDDATRSQSAPPELCNAAFRVSANVGLGEDLRVVGDCPELGDWDVSLAPSLLLCRDSLYRRLRTLPRDCNVTYKVVKVLADGSCEWEFGEDRVLVPEELANSVLVVDVQFSGSMRVAEGTPEHMQAEVSFVLDAVNLAESMHQAEKRGSYDLELVAAEPPPPARELRVCGSCPSLGNWNPARAPAMAQQPSGLLSLHARLPAVESVEFKLVEVATGGTDPMWQEGPNIVMDLRMGLAHSRVRLAMDSRLSGPLPDSADLPCPSPMESFRRFLWAGLVEQANGWPFKPHKKRDHEVHMPM